MNNELNKKKILEALQMQPLSEEEKSARHILGRLYGPIATTKDSTRNGRLYNEQLWRNALQDEIFLEKVKNKGLFLELGHPADREEIDMSKACACIPDVPKIVNGDLYAYVDILDTPSGRILKTLCDYGFQPGISSRGSGDVDMNNEVDPETFFLETFDIVNIPAVKKARLAVCESLNTEQLKLRKALVESLNKAEEKDKAIMKESLSNLKITLNEDVDGEIEPEIEAPVKDAMPMEIGEPEIVYPEASEEIPAEEASEVEALTVGDIAQQLTDFDPEEPIEFAPIIIDGKEYQINALNWNEDEDGKVVLNIGYTLPIEGDNIDGQEVPEQIESEVEITATEPEIADEESQEFEDEEAIDNGAAELISSLKEMIRQKESLENDVKTLKESKSVSDAKVKALKEELDQYKNSFARLSDLAVEAKQAKKDVQKLTEQLEQNKTLINNLKAKQIDADQLTESINAKANQAKVAAKKLTEATEKIETLNKQLREQTNRYNTEIKKRTDIAKAYRTKFTEAVNKYIEMRASMLGVRSTDIISRLNENFTFNDIDKVCEQFIAQSRPVFGLPTSSRIKITESKQTKSSIQNPENGYDIDDDLLILAGLK